MSKRIRSHLPGSAAAWLDLGKATLRPVPSGVGHEPHRFVRINPEERPQPIDASRKHQPSPLLSQLIGRAIEPAIAHPKFDLVAAIADPGFLARNPGELAVPPALVQQFESMKGKKVLVIGHIESDADTVGSSLSTAQLLRALGAEVEICIDWPLAGSLRRIDQHREIKRAADIPKDAHYDHVVMVDVAIASKDRLGDALELVKRGKSLTIIDHHLFLEPPSPEAFGLPEDHPLTTWIEPEFPAAGLSVAALIERLRPQMALFATEAGRAPPNDRDLLLGTLAGFATDTDWGHRPGIDREAYRYFKHMLLASGIPLDELERVAANKLPSGVTAVIDEFSEEQLTTPRGERLSVLRCPAKALARLVEIGRHIDPELSEKDVIFGLKQRLDAALEPRGQAQASLLFYEQDGQIHVSTRSLFDGTAQELAKLFSGGGHGRLAHGVSTLPLRESLARLRAFCAGTLTEH